MKKSGNESQELDSDHEQLDAKNQRKKVLNDYFRGNIEKAESNIQKRTTSDSFSGMLEDMSKNLLII